MRIPVSVLVLVILVTGCGGPSKPAWNSAEQFFVEWLKGHGEQHVVVTPEGVGVEGNATRLKASVWGSDKHKDGGNSVEMEFRVLLPTGDEIVEYVAGLGDTMEQASNDCYANFVLTTLHPIYKSFINPNDPHQTVTEVVIAGVSRDMVMGDIFVKGTEESSNIDIDALRPQIQAAITALPLSEKTHWLKVVYGQINSQPILSAATLDNKDQNELAGVIQNLPWPRQYEFYIVKVFVVIK